MKLVYLASPYSHKEESVRAYRYAQACYATSLILRGRLFGQRWNVFSPIVHSHPLAVHHNMGGSFEDWKEVDEDWISRCDEMIVLKLDGWEESRGVKAEIDFAQSLRIPIAYLTIDELEQYGRTPEEASQ